jgi:hypothetical protein
MGIVVVQHCTTAADTVDCLQSGVNTINAADTSLIPVAQDRLVKASRIAGEYVLEVLSVTFLNLAYHTVVDIKRITKAPAYVREVCSSNHTHPTWCGVNHVTTDVEERLYLRWRY